MVKIPSFTIADATGTVIDFVSPDDGRRYQITVRLAVVSITDNGSQVDMNKDRFKVDGIVNMTVEAKAKGS